MLKSAALQSIGGKLLCTLVTEGGAELAFEVADHPELRFGKGSKADNTHVDLTLTVRVGSLATFTMQPELL